MSRRSPQQEQRDALRIMLENALYAMQRFLFGKTQIETAQQQLAAAYDAEKESEEGIVLTRQEELVPEQTPEVSAEQEVHKFLDRILVAIFRTTQAIRNEFRAKIAEAVSAAVEEFAGDEHGVAGEVTQAMESVVDHVFQPAAVIPRVTQTFQKIAKPTPAAPSAPAVIEEPEIKEMQPEYQAQARELGQKASTAAVSKTSSEAATEAMQATLYSMLATEATKRSAQMSAASKPVYMSATVRFFQQVDLVAVVQQLERTLQAQSFSYGYYQTPFPLFNTRSSRELQKAFDDVLSVREQLAVFSV